MQIDTQAFVLSVPSLTPEPLRPSSELLAAWLLVLVEGGVTYGYDMRRELAARRLEVDYPSVYRMLRKLQREGQLRSRWGKTVVGPRRRLYEITPAGLDNLAEIAERLRAITQTHDALLQAYEQTSGRDDGGAPGQDEPSAPATPQRRSDVPALDHVALSVQDPGAMEAFLCDHVGMQELGRSADCLIVGADARATKLSLSPAEGPREPAALARLVLRVADLQRAMEMLPDDTEVQRQAPHTITFTGPEGLGLGFTLMAGGEIEYDLARVILRVADPEETRITLAALGCAAHGGTLHLGDKSITLEELPAWSDRPLLDHIAVGVGSVEALARQARQRGLEIDEHLAGESVTVVLPGPERVRFEFVQRTLAD